MMKRALLATVLALLPLCALAQRAPTLSNALTDFATRALPKCPDQKVSVTPFGQPGGPSGFTVFVLTQESSDPSCQRKTYMLHSPRTGQILTGTIFTLEPDGRPVTARIAAVASAALKEPVVATVAPFPLPDGIHAVSIVKQSKSAGGGFTYHGFLDESNSYLIVGTRGNLNSDPGKTLIESIGLAGATHRGNPKAKVQIIELSDFECPTCAKAHKKVEPIISKNLDKVDYYRLDLPLFEHHEWALAAALGARALSKVAPSKYWAYGNFVFENQETIGKQQFDKVLQNFFEDNDVNWKAVEKIYRSPVEKKALIDQVSRAFDNGILSTPTYIINGQILGFGPEGTFTIEAIKKAMGVK
jgi:protein-disulfide isomerase